MKNIEEIIELLQDFHRRYPKITKVVLETASNDYYVVDDVVVDDVDIDPVNGGIVVSIVPEEG